tara:strand:+ start:200 stop:529 length:330 start_codon:yes stop_codon:yes gene_type:complete
MPYIGNVSPFESVGTSELKDGSVTAAKIVDNAVTTAKILDGSVTAAKINSSVALGGPSLGTNSVVRTNAKVIDENITFTGNENGSSVGPITVASGRVITVASGSTWVVL